MKDFAPRLFKSLSQLEENSQVLHSTLKDFDAPSSTYLQVEILGTPTMAVIDTGAPLVILSSRFASKLRLQPDLEYSKFFGTAGQSKVQALGAYLSLPISIGNIHTTSPAIISNASDTKFYWELAISKDTALSLTIGTTPLIFLDTRFRFSNKMAP